MLSTKTQAENAAVAWFGDGFGHFHPLLQALHKQSSRLHGPVIFSFSKGIAGIFGRRLARHLGIPDTAGEHHINVEIVHDQTQMSWKRSFDHSFSLHSIFEPVGSWPSGYWLERTNALEFTLSVEIVDGGWHWDVIAARYRGFKLPLWVLPRVKAYKKIEADQYRFHAGFALPLLGEIFSYGGLLKSETKGADE